MENNVSKRRSSVPIRRRWPAFWFVLLGLGLADVAIAAPTPTPTCDSDFPDRCAVPLEAGAPAPFGGQLLSPELALALGQKADRQDRLLRLEVATATRTEAARGKLETALCGVDLRASKAESLAQQRRAERAEGAAERGLLEHPVLWLLVGVAAMAGAFALAKGTGQAFD